jgi:endonuclease/exonuclease/phosphatase (EEP) superfamily protein YafD
LIIAFVGFCLGLATLIGFLGNAWWVFDLFASFRHQLAVGLILCGLALSLAKWRKSAVAVGLLAAVNIVTIVPFFIGPSRPDTADLRILSFNILASNRRFDDVVAFIRDSDADVVILHEVTSRWERVMEEAAAIYPDFDYEITETRAGGDLFGTLALTPTGAEVQSFGFGENDPRAIQILLPDGVAILGIHPLSPYTEFRAGRNDQQLEFAASWALAQDGPTVLVGDFNATPWSYPFRRLVATADLSNSMEGFGLELSYPADSNPLVRIPIDHLLYSDELAVVDRRLGPRLGSDHLSLTVDLALVGS